MGKIFISYRREDSADVTGRMRDRLVSRFGNDNVFVDVDSIPLGVDFRAHLTDGVQHCEILLVVIGRRWLDAGSDSGKRRLDDDNDFVRIEIEAALQRDIPVIPVLVQGAPMPSPENLPPTLKALAFRNGTQLRPDPDFGRDVKRLITRIKAILRNRERPAAEGGAVDERRQQETKDVKPAAKLEIRSPADAKALNLLSADGGGNARRFTRWPRSRILSSIAGAIGTGLLGGIYGLLETSISEPHPNPANHVSEAIYYGLLSSLLGAIGGACAKSVWPWLVVVTLALFLPVVQASMHGLSSAVAEAAWAGALYGWLAVLVVLAMARVPNPLWRRSEGLRNWISRRLYRDSEK
jgi:hypothetical protein